MILEFGKYKGLSIYSVADDDPSYVIWLAQETNTDVPLDAIAWANDAMMEPDYEDLHGDDWGCRD